MYSDVTSACACNIICIMYSVVTCACACNIIECTVMLHVHVATSQFLTILL